MHRLGVGKFGIGYSPAGIGDDGARGGGKTVAEAVVFARHPHHGRFLPRFHDRFMKSSVLRPSHGGLPLLHSPRNARGIARASHFDAGWSSPVARQAHNLKVVGSNPTPATNKAAKQIAWRLFVFLRTGSSTGTLLFGDLFQPFKRSISDAISVGCSLQTQLTPKSSIVRFGPRVEAFGDVEILHRQERSRAFSSTGESCSFRNLLFETQAVAEGVDRVHHLCAIGRDVEAGAVVFIILAKKLAHGTSRCPSF